MKITVNNNGKIKKVKRTRKTVVSKDNVVEKVRSVHVQYTDEDAVGALAKNLTVTGAAYSYDGNKISIDIKEYTPPEYAKVALTGSYNDLKDVPVIELPDFSALKDEIKQEAKEQAVKLVDGVYMPKEGFSKLLMEHMSGSGDTIVTYDKKRDKVKVTTYVSAVSGTGTVFTDGVTITGDGSQANPLVSVGGSAVWGAITGTLSDQTDLQTELDAKVDTTTTVNGQALSSNVTLDAGDIDPVTDRNYVTDEDLVVLSNTSGMNTGDQDLSSYVVGPVSSDDNAIARYDSTTGKIIQNSALSLSDSGSLNFSTNQSIMVDSFDYIVFRNYGGGQVNIPRQLGYTTDTIAAGSTVNVASSNSRNILCDGSGATIASFGTFAIDSNYGIQFQVRFNGINTITHNSGSGINCITGSDVTTADGDIGIFETTGTGGSVTTIRMVAYFRKDGTALASSEGGGDVSGPVSSTDNAISVWDGSGGDTLKDSTILVSSSTITPSVTDAGSLGTSSLNWSDLFLDSGGVINFDSGDVTITHSANALTFAGATTNGYQFQDGPIRPVSNDGVALGTSSSSFSDLFLASGGVINWANGDITITHSTNTMAFAGAATAYTFNGGPVRPSSNDGVALGSSGTAWSDLFLASGGVLNWNAGDVTVTHSANALTFAGADNGFTFNSDIVVNNEIRIDATPGTDHTATGPTTNALNAGTTISAFQLLFLASDGEWALADADAASTSTGMLSLALASGTDGNPIKVALPGSFVRDDTWAWTVGGILYVDTTSGAMSHTAPSGTGDIVRVVGYAVNADVVYFNPDGAWVEVA